MTERTVINISVIIPAYNSEATIVETIKSVQLQTYDHWEIIVVDDGSVDKTVLLVNDLAKKDNRIRLITQKNQHVSAARNTGINNARYDWLLFLDSDDWIAAHYFERITSVLASDPQIDAVHCGWTRVTPDGKIVREMYAASLPDLFPVLAKFCPFAIHACVIRKSLVELAGGFDTSLKTCEDWDLWLKIARIGARFEAVKEVMAFYRMVPNSLSSNGLQFFRDAIRVLEHAYSADDRLKNLNLLHPEGEPAELLPGRKLFIATWLGGLLIGDGKEAAHLLGLLSNDRDPSLEPYWVADNIFDSAIIPTCKAHSDWHLLYPKIQKNIKEFLFALEAQSGATALASRSIINLEKMILQNTQVDEPVVIGSYNTVSIEITEPIRDVLVDNDELHRLLCFLKIEGKELGKIELPICDGMVSEWVLKDAIAAQYAWPILSKFLENTVYNKTAFQNKSFEEIHDETGWITFLQQIWSRPNWENRKFYNPESIKETGVKKINSADIKVIEISEELPDITIDSEEFHAVFSVGGVQAGVINIPVKSKLVTASEIRASINTDAGFELCRIAVREALVGKSLHEPVTLAQRLVDAAIANKDYKLPSIVTADSLVLGRRPGPFGISASRRAMLPAASGPCLIEMAKAVNEPLIQLPADINNIDKVLYIPEMITPEAQVRQNNMTENKAMEANVYGRQHFETLFSKQPDPWKYTIPYEQTKYEFTLSLLPKQKINKALEIACAEGHFTEQLAPLVDNLIAVDISQVALERAAERGKHFDHIKYQHLDLVEDNFPGQFDLITCSEVLYYVGSLDKLKAVAKKIAEALLPEGYLVMAHANQVIDEPTQPGFDWGLSFGAKVIGETFAKTPSLQLVKEIRTPLYRVQLFQRKETKLFSWLNKKTSVQYFDQPTPVPDDVKDSVRWNGGEPSHSTIISTVITDNLPILMYHRVAPDGAKNMSRYRVTPAVFEEQLKYLKDSGYYSVNLNDWLIAVTAKRPLPGLAVAFTFDDAYQDFYEYAWPLLKKYGFNATVFLVSDYVGKQNSWDKAYGENLPLMGWKEILELQQQGVEFGSHTATHKPLTSLSPADIVFEGARSRTNLQNNLQKPVKLIAYPYGDTDTVVSHLIGGCGYTLGFSCQTKLSSFSDDTMQLPRIEVEGSFNLKEFVAKLS